LGLSMQTQAGVPYPFAGGQHFAGSAPFGGISPLSTIPQLYAGLQPNGGGQQPYPFPQGFSFPQTAGASQGWGAQAGQIWPAGVLGVVVWMQQHIAQQLATLIALSQLSAPWSAGPSPAFQPPQTFQPQQTMPGTAFGGGSGPFARPGLPY
jgi:hypothetical protein